MVFNPSGDTQIRAGGMLICIGRAESMAELTAQARGAARRTEKTPGGADK